MGMDIYGQNHERLTKKVWVKFDQAVAHRDQLPRKSKEYKEAQKKVHRWYEELHKPEPSSTFTNPARNSYSLSLLRFASTWLESASRAAGGWSRSSVRRIAQKANPIRSSCLIHPELVKTAKEWYDTVRTGQEGNQSQRFYSRLRSPTHLGGGWASEKRNPLWLAGGTKLIKVHKGRPPARSAGARGRNPAGMGIPLDRIGHQIKLVGAPLTFLSAPRSKNNRGT